MANAGGQGLNPNATVMFHGAPTPGAAPTPEPPAVPRVTAAPDVTSPFVADEFKQDSGIAVPPEAGGSAEQTVETVAAPPLPAELATAAKQTLAPPPEPLLMTGYGSAAKEAVPHGPHPLEAEGPSPEEVAAIDRDRAAQAQSRLMDRVVQAGVVEEAATEVAFFTNQGTLRTVYPLCIGADNCIVLGYKTPLPVGISIFEPASMVQMDIEIDGRRFKVSNINLTFTFAGFRLLVLPVIPDEEPPSGIVSPVGELDA